MNRLLPTSLIVVGLMLFGCGKPQRGSGDGSSSSAPGNSTKVESMAVPKIGTASARPVMAQPSAATSVTSAAHYSKNFEQLFASGSLNALYRTPDVLKDPEIARLLLEKFQTEWRDRRFWREGVSLLGETGDKSVAAALWKEWKTLPVYERTNAAGWGQIQEEYFHPRSSVIRAVFRIGDVETIKAVWQHFPEGAEGDQLLVAKASNDVLDPFVAAEVVRVIDAAKSERVRIELVNAANRILYHLFTGGSEMDRRWARETAIPLLSEMKKRGLVRDFLEKILPP